MINAGELFAGASLGGAFGPVFDVLREVVEKAAGFHPTLKSIKFTVDSLAALIPQIEGHNNTLGGNRAGEVEKLNEKMEEGRMLIEELMEVGEWNCLKAYHTGQLIELDESLKTHLEILQVQVVVDVKEILVVSKESREDVKETLVVIEAMSRDVKEGLTVTKENTRFLEHIFLLGAEETAKQVGRLESTLKAELSDVEKNLQKQQEGVIDGMIRKLKYFGMGNKVDSLLDAAALGASLQELSDMVNREANNSRKHLIKIYTRVTSIFELIETKWEENKEVSYIPTEELRNFRVQIEEGVELVRNCTKVVEWTDDLESEYTNKVLPLEDTLERLYNRLNGIHPFKWATGQCGTCTSGTTSMRDFVITGDRVSL